MRAGGWLAPLVSLSLLLSIASCLPIDANAADRKSLKDALRGWIKNDLYFFKDSGGHPRLFARREPVRAMRANATRSIRASEGYFYYLQLATALRTCDLKIDGTRRDVEHDSLEDRYINCAVEILIRG